MTALTKHYPLQPFSPRYFNNEYQTYAYEWQTAHQAEQQTEQTDTTVNYDDALPVLSVRLLDDFLANPCRHYLNQRFKTRFYGSALMNNDDEPFVLDRLQLYQLKQQLLQQLLHQPDLDLSAAVAQLARQAKLPLALFGQDTAEELQREAEVVFNRYRADGVQWQKAAQPLAISLQLAGIELNDTLTQLYQAGLTQDQQALILLRPTAIQDKKQVRWHTLRSSWLQQLVANAQGATVSTLQYGLDAKVQLVAQQQDVALAQLQQLVQHWQQGIKQPLPVMPKTAICWLQTQDAEKCRQIYEGGYMMGGERDYSPELQRYYPDFASLQQAGFSEWAENLYQPLLNTKLAEQESDVE